LAKRITKQRELFAGYESNNNGSGGQGGNGGGGPTAIRRIKL